MTTTPDPQPAAEPADLVAASRPHRRLGMRRTALIAAASALVLGGVVGASAVTDADTTTAAAVVEDAQTGTADTPELGEAWSDTGAPGGTRSGAALPSAPGASSGVAGTLQEEATVAADEETAGMVLIDTVLGYDGGEAAGTGMVLTEDGLVLTNNHVIADSTEITVTVGDTGETYSATVVGVDASDDVALLQLEDASGLATVAIDDDGVLAGDTVTAVGNASGGGVLMAADGSVTALESSVTTSAEFGEEGETLDGMIQFAADVVAGDSGGALIDSEGEVVGMTTAASSGLATTVAFAIPIEDALAIVAQIQAGEETDGVTLGYPAMLGVAVSAGAQIEYVWAGTPAAAAGLAAGDTVTSVDGTAVANGDELSALLSGYEPGDTVTLTWVDATGADQQAAVTLAQGPAL